MCVPWKNKRKVNVFRTQGAYGRLRAGTGAGGGRHARRGGGLVQRRQKNYWR